MEPWQPWAPPLPKAGREEVLAALPVAVVHIYTTWNGADWAIAPVIKHVAPDYSEITFFSVDIDEEPEFADRFREWHVPVLHCFFSGQLHGTSIGYLSADLLRAKLREWLAAST